MDAYSLRVSLKLVIYEPILKVLRLSGWKITAKERMKGKKSANQK